jgi:hypothetical protein
MTVDNGMTGSVAFVNMSCLAEKRRIHHDQKRERAGKNLPHENCYCR